MSMFELIVVGLLLTMLIGMFIISRWVIIVIINNRLINRKIEQHNLIDLELRFFRFLHFNGYEQKESSKYYLGMILENFLESKVIENEKKEKYKEIYETFIKNQKT
ncbi:MAG: hypothetical protein ACJ0F0_00165 [Burkholderiaceae bacterium]